MSIAKINVFRNAIPICPDIKFIIIMSLSLADITELKQEFQKTIKQLDMQIQTMETSYLEQTKETGNIIKGFDNYVNAKMNPRGAMQARSQRIDVKDRLFTLSSVKASSGYKLEQVVEVKIEPPGQGAPRNRRRNKKKNYNKGVGDSGDDGDSMGNSHNTYQEDYSKGKRRN